MVMDTRDRLVGALRSVLPKAAREVAITPDTTLVELGMDSLILLEFLLSLESEFALDLGRDIEALKGLSTVGEAIALIESHHTRS